MSLKNYGSMFNFFFVVELQNIRYKIVTDVCDKARDKLERKLHIMKRR